MMDTAVFENDTLTIRADAFAAEIHVKQIEAKWHNLSLDPERRARGQLNMLAERLNAFAALCSIRHRLPLPFSCDAGHCAVR